MLWEKPDGKNLDELEPATIAANTVRWIDTSCMIVDCLTKRMKPTVLLKLMKTGELCLEATAESQLLKMLKQKRRREAKPE